MYYIWSQDWDYPEADEIEIPEIWENDLLISAQRVDNELPPLHFFSPTLTKLPDALVNRWGYLVFSSKLGQVLDRVTSDEIQYLKAVIHDKKTNEQRKDYRVANLLVEVEAIDRSRSSLEYSGDGDIVGINSLVLDESRAGNHSFFRLGEFVSIIIVHDSVAKEIERNSCTGIKFMVPEKFRA